MKNGFTKTVVNCFLVFTLFAAMSFANTKKVTYFPEVKDGPIPSNTPFVESTIQKSDILSIVVTSASPEASAQFNRTDAAGYLVNSEGNIEFPQLGNIK